MEPSPDLIRTSTDPFSGFFFFIAVYLPNLPISRVVFSFGVFPCFMIIFGGVIQAGDKV